MATQTASAMLKEIAAYETYSADAATITQTYRICSVIVKITTIQLYVTLYENGKDVGYFMTSLKPRPRVWKFLRKSGLRVTQNYRLVELKECLLEAARYEKFKALAH